MTSNERPIICVDREISRGAFGAIFIAYHQQKKQNVAVKKILSGEGECDECESLPVSALREATILLQLCHPNIVKLLEKPVKQEGSWWLIMDHYDMDLGDYIHEFTLNYLLPDDVVKYFMFQLVSGLNYCHNKKIIHRDIKPDNILVKKDGRLVIGDFGWAMMQSVPHRNCHVQVITQNYRPPEILLGKNAYSSEIDMWSLGCVFAEMVTKAVYFNGNDDDPIHQFYSILSRIGTPSDWSIYDNLPMKSEYIHIINSKYNCVRQDDLYNLFTPPGLELLQGLLELDPTKRWSAEKTARCEYVTKQVVKAVLWPCEMEE